jgi:predicted nuclease with TOPRIM domain
LTSGDGLRPTLRLALATCTAFTLATSAMAQTTGNVVVDPVDRTAQEATPTVSETLMGVVDRVERLSGRVDPIKEDYVICRSTAVREGAGEASEPQLIACGIALETQRIAFFEDTKAALKQSSIDAAVQEELIEKDLMRTNAELEATRKALDEIEDTQALVEDAFQDRNATAGPPQTQAEQEAYNALDRKWRELDSRKRFLEALAEAHGKKYAFQERDKAAFGQLRYVLNQGSLDQDLYIQEAQQGIALAKATGEALGLATRMPNSMSEISDALGDLIGFGGYHPEALPNLSDLTPGAVPNLAGSGAEDGYKAFLERTGLTSEVGQ